jgi:general secretion pathway protein M
MNETLSIWWRGRTLREQRLLLAMAGLLGVVLALLLIVRPLGDSLSAARGRHAAIVLRLAEARGQAAAIRSLQSVQPVALPGPLASVLTGAAAEAGFQAARVEPGGPNQATVIIDSARPQALFAWVRRMEQQNGLIVDRLTATTNSDQTLAVQVAFRARGG